MTYPIEITTSTQRQLYDYFLALYREDVGEPNSQNCEALASYAVLFLEIRTIKKYLKKHGTTYESYTDRGGMTIKQRPEVTQLDKMETRIFQMKQRLGFYDRDESTVGDELGGLGAFLTKA